MLAAMIRPTAEQRAAAMRRLADTRRRQLAGEFSADEAARRLGVARSVYYTALRETETALLAAGYPAEAAALRLPKATS